MKDKQTDRKAKGAVKRLLPQSAGKGDYTGEREKIIGAFEFDDIVNNVRELDRKAKR
jgi:hypothetical protein